VIGVLLTGYLDCGTAGMMSIKARGGVTVVQDPKDAEAPEMPRHALEHVAVDHVVPLEHLAALLVRLVNEPAGTWPAHLPGALHELEGDELGISADLVCPTCQGKLTETELNGFQQFRCHVGHAFSLESVTFEQAEAVERALCAAARALEESAMLARRLADRSSGERHARFEEKVAAQTAQAEVIRQLALGGTALTRKDAADLDEHEAPTSRRLGKGD
jgi:two-component system, chemotaxis family, protein-glutamate methylesterase/glutaminase